MTLFLLQRLFNVELNVRLIIIISRSNKKPPWPILSIIIYILREAAACRIILFTNNLLFTTISNTVEMSLLYERKAVKNV